METCVQLSILIPNKPFFCWTNNWLSVCCKSVWVNFHALSGASIPEGWVDCVGCVPGIVTSEALSLPVTQMLLISRSLVSNSLQPYAHQASLFFTISWSLLKLTSIELVMPSNHLILCCPLLLPSIFPSIRVFSSESVLHIR